MGCMNCREEEADPWTENEACQISLLTFHVNKTELEMVQAIKCRRLFFFLKSLVNISGTGISCHGYD